ncbi:bifunctional 5,10-methylenetetrahydrofolate dehydrogenase/5,10-methenyltetrahydrofolate cyclohydrolase [Alkaliphilus peptidifermentans]|uniref:Bifunctional protein FolD n=1 Tax=Alkaliphilus peptidifermentans DSM 18978 TaxID=1120976 RepID=A0A1G5JT46_9FIRM|nr:bifunctional 5,10-methylenetetrahydrofolate dehydrogenase/5,10-methenyltetrahydrofolate cyclohydrolase [Alkaliphilus peptidifermentans]SCY91091.1 methenyltetrahydrofolate cyclohydrolase [Alkaliphilus peptidifermentans DSM 18978]
MTKILTGKEVKKSIQQNIQEKIEALNKQDIYPKLAIVRVGKREDDIAYEKNIIKNCHQMKIETHLCHLDLNISLEEFKREIGALNDNDDIHGILIFRPLPIQLPQEIVKYLVSPEKDIDCMHPINLGKVFEGELDGLVPCTSKAVIEILKYYEIPLAGSNVIVINSSVVVGKPLAMMLIQDGATPTICHSKSKDIQGITTNADIIVTAIGKPKFFDEKYFSQEAIVIDVGINADEEGSICGDVDYNKVVDIVAGITPVPNGVGTVTTTLLLENLVKAAYIIKGVQ